jgi:hypothetical protein
VLQVQTSSNGLLPQKGEHNQQAKTFPCIHISFIDDRHSQVFDAKRG